MSKNKQEMTSTSKKTGKRQELSPSLKLITDGVQSYTTTMRRISDETRNAARSNYSPKVGPEGKGILAADFDAKSWEEERDNMIAALQACGTSDPDFLLALARQLIPTCPPHEKERVGWQNGVLAMLHGIAP